MTIAIDDSNINEYKNCTLCPRSCGVDRTMKTGYCHELSDLHVARASLHMWEEPCISGKRGSGTVFFSGCNMGCVFCQNKAISRGETGKIITTDRLVDIFFELEEMGANNINLVTGDMFIPHIRKAIETARNRGISIPFLMNTSSYLNDDSVRSLEGLIDIYLPDFKYIREQDAIRFSNAPGYVEAAKAAIAEMVRQQPKCELYELADDSDESDDAEDSDGSDDTEDSDDKKLMSSKSTGDDKARNLESTGDDKARNLEGTGDDKARNLEDTGHDKALGERIVDGSERMIARKSVPENGMLRKGVVVRHLLMPGMLIQAKLIVKYLYEQYGDSIYISLMNQYTPNGQLMGFPEIDRKVTASEYNSLIDYAAQIGVTYGFMQVGETATESFIPDFDCRGV